MSKGQDDTNPGTPDDRGRGADDPAGHDLGDDKGGQRPAGTSDDDPATHDVGDDKGGLRPAGASDDDPATHDLGDDHGSDRLQLVFNDRSGQWIFTDDSTEHARWIEDHGRHHGGEVRLSLPASVDDHAVSVWRFHDAQSDVYFWTADVAMRDAIRSSHPEVEFEGEAFKAYADDHGGHAAIGLVWDQAAGPYGNFIYLPVDDAVRLAGQSSDDAMVYLGVSFYI